MFPSFPPNFPAALAFPLVSRDIVHCTNTALDLAPPQHMTRVFPPSYTPAKSISLPRRFGTRRATHTSLIPAPRPQPFLGAQFQFALQLRAWFFAVDEVAKPAAHAAFAAVQPAAGFPEIGHG